MLYHRRPGTKDCDRIKMLVGVLNYYRERYYCDAVSDIDDFQYDKLELELERLEAKHPDLVAGSSPIGTVGSDMKVDYDNTMCRRCLMAYYNCEEEF